MAQKSAADRYFKFLRTPYKDENGDTRQPTSSRFVDQLEVIHASYKPRYDLTACLSRAQPKFSGQVWFWSDLHLFHTNIIKYCDRPFSDVGEMNKALLTNCLKRVSANDILVFGGDIMMSNLPGANQILRAMPGFKINVLGNHDVQNKTNELLRLAVDEVAPCIEFEFNGTSFLLTHYPVPESLLASGQVNIHGHTHRNPVPSALGSGERHINLCVEHTEYSPVRQDWLLAKV